MLRNHNAPLFSLFMETVPFLYHSLQRWERGKGEERREERRKEREREKDGERKERREKQERREEIGEHSEQRGKGEEVKSTARER